MKRLSRILMLSVLLATDALGTDASTNSSPRLETSVTVTNTSPPDLSFPSHWSKRWEVTKLSGNFSTYSAPREGTYCLLDMTELLNKDGKPLIKFVNEKDEFDWYLPYYRPFRVARIEKDHDGNVVGLKLIAERMENFGSFRWTLSLKNGKGFLIFEKDDFVSGVIALRGRKP